MSGPYFVPRDGRGNISSNAHGGFGRGGRGMGTGPALGRIQSSLQPEALHVITNLFRVGHYGDPSKPGHQWYMYRLSVTPLKGLIKYEEQDIRWKDKPDANPRKIDRMREGLKENGSTELSRALFRKLSDEIWEKNAIILATDSAHTGVSNEKIPLDESDGIFLLKVDNRGFRVEIEFTNEVSMGIFSRQPTSEEQLAAVDVAKQCLEIMFKYGLGRTCLSCDTNPQTFFLPEHLQKQLATRTKSPLISHWSRLGQMAPFEGITQSARYTKTGEFVMAINNKVDWLYRDSSVSGEDIPILDQNMCTIAGVKIGSLEREVSPKVLEEVEAALVKMKLKVKYQKGPEWKKERRAFLKARDKDDDFIEAYISKHQIFRLVHSKMIAKNEIDRSRRILLSCADETFSKDGVEHNIQSYFLKYYDIRVNFPHLPVVSVGARGYFPVEFLYQEKSRVGGNEKHLQDVVLRYHDHFSGYDRAKHVRNLKNEAYGVENVDVSFRSLYGLLQAFQISIEQDPVCSLADILPRPCPQFGENRTINVMRGSWNLIDKVFASPADLVMPIILDFTKEDGGFPVDEMISALFQSMSGHGIRVCKRWTEESEGAPGWQDLIYKYEGSLEFDKISVFVKEIVRDARLKFLRCRAPLFSCVVGPNGDVENTWMVKRGDTWFRIPPAVSKPCEGDAGETHLIYSLKNPEQTANARVQFCVQGNWKDPSDTRADDVIESCDRFKIWADDRWITVDGKDVEVAKQYSPLSDWQIECPSMILCYISEVDTALYNLLKTVCDISVGLNSQILVKAKASAQASDRNHLSQFCSNVALKVNTKLFNRGNRAVAWTIPTKWYLESPTIIIGYSMANGRVHGVASTALAGSVCLFHPMQMGQAVKLYRAERRRDVVDSQALRSLISDLVVNHFAHTRQTAERVIVYRDGGSRGSLGNIKSEELTIIREVFRDVFPESSPPGMTFVVSNKDHNINIVPAVKDNRHRNVPSGTTVGVVEDFKLDNQDTVGEFSFLLTAQDGLKGTSKPMFYTCLLNENQSSGLDKAALKSLTYDLSFQYGSATKSPRKVPVLLNSEKLANRALNYAPYFDMAGVDICQSEGENSEHHFGRADQIGAQILSRCFYPSFGVRDSRCSQADHNHPAGLNFWRAPFRAHITG